MKTDKTDYLDNLAPKTGTKVICVHNISNDWFTVGKVYTVKTFKRLQDDFGNLVYTSARFKILINQ